MRKKIQYFREPFKTVQPKTAHNPDFRQKNCFDNFQRSLLALIFCYNTAVNN